MANRLMEQNPGVRVETVGGQILAAAGRKPESADDGKS